MTVAALASALGAASVLAQTAVELPAGPKPEAGPRMQIYGFAALNLIYDFDQVNPDWYDMLRPSKLPAFPNEFGENGNFWASVRQTRFGVRSWLPTGLGEVKTEFEFDLSASAPTPARRRFTCVRPGASSGRFSPARLSASSWTWTSFRESWSTSGPTAWSSTATCSCAGRRSRERSASIVRPRAARSQRRQRRVCRPGRAAGHRGPFPVPGLHGAVPLRRGLGARPARRNRALHRVD